MAPIYRYYDTVTKRRFTTALLAAKSLGISAQQFRVYFSDPYFRVKKIGPPTVRKPLRMGRGMGLMMGSRR